MGEVSERKEARPRLEPGESLMDRQAVAAMIGVEAQTISNWLCNPNHQFPKGFRLGPGPRAPRRWFPCEVRKYQSSRFGPPDPGPDQSARNAAATEERLRIEMEAEPDGGLHELYRHFDSAGDLLYVGISCSTMSRLAQHRAKSEWYRLSVNMTIERYPTRRALEAAEKHAIRSERPRFNITHALP